MSTISKSKKINNLFNPAKLKSYTADKLAPTVLCVFGEKRETYGQQTFLLFNQCFFSGTLNLESFGQG